MKTNIKIPANSTRTRVLSAFMAFLIFTLTFQQAFVGWGGIKVKATNGLSDSTIGTLANSNADRADSALITGGNGTYTG